MKLLLTGATGFVGRNLMLRALAENRYDEIWVPVRSVSRLRQFFTDDGFENIPARVKPVETSAPHWDLSAVPEVDHVIHGAGVLFAGDEKTYFETNVQGSLELFRALKSLPKKAVVMSSQAAGGPCLGEMTEKSEGDQDLPITWYGKSKLKMESELLAQFPDLNVLFLRPPMVLGPRDQATLPLFKMVRSPLFFKPGLKVKHLSYISVFDLVSAAFAVLDDGEVWDERGRKPYYVSSENPVTDRELISLTAKASNRKGILVSIPQPLLRFIASLMDHFAYWRKNFPSLSGDRALEVWPDRWVVNSKAFYEAFRWQPLEKLPVTLQKTREWYSKTGQL